MATYLIDYENVKSEGIKGIAQLSEEDTVVIFYSHNADTITFEAMDMIFSSKAQVRKYKILCGGKNALDFQLSTYLGYLIHEAKDSYFYIISKDNGFKHVVDFWKRTFRYEGYVYCFSTIADGNARQNRFKNATAKERQRVMEEELVAMSEELEAEAQEEIGQENQESEQETAQEAIQEPIQENVPEEVQDEMPDEISETVEDEIPAPAEDEAEETVENEVTAPAEETVPEAVETQAQETVSEPEEEAGAEEAPDTKEEPLIYPIRRHSPVSVMPPAQLPDSVRRELEKADAEYASNENERETDLEQKIAAAVPAAEIKMTVVESGMTVHHVEPEIRPSEPTAETSGSESEPVSEEKESSVREEKTDKQTHHAKRTGRRKKPTAQAEDDTVKKPAERAGQTEDKPERKVQTDEGKAAAQAKADADAKADRELKSKTVRKPKNQKVSNEVPAAEEAVNAEEKPAKTGRKPAARKTPKGKTEKADAPEKKPVQIGAEQPEKKPVRRGRRPKTQSNIAASFE